MPLTQDEPCTLLHMVGGKLVEVAGGTAVPGRVMHHRTIPEDVIQVTISLVVPEYRDVLPPHQPPGAEPENPVVIGDLGKWRMTWPKNLVRLGGGAPSARRNTGATSPAVRLPPRIVRPAKNVQAAATLKLKEPAGAAATALKEPAVAAAATTMKEPAVDAAATTRGKEPVIAATTTRHKQLLGNKLPVRPETRRKVRQASQPPPASPPPAQPSFQDMAPLDGNNDDEDEDVDVNAYLNTGACQDQFMPPMDDEAFRTQDDQLGRRPSSVTQRLTFTGLSLQDTPPEVGNPASQVKTATIFSPNTLHRTIGGESTPAPEAPPAPQAPPSAPPATEASQGKKHRKRTKNKVPSTSHAVSKRIRVDDTVPKAPSGFPRLHQAGKPILPKDLEHLASGQMLTLQKNIQFLESRLLQDKDPNYPVFTVKVPEADPNFVQGEPANIFFVAFEDVFNLFYWRRLDYNLVRLYAINLQLKIKRERPPNVAVADPYYMRDSQLADGSSTRTAAVRYLQSFLLMNKDKNTILLPVFPE